MLQQRHRGKRSWVLPLLAIVLFSVAPGSRATREATAGAVDSGSASSLVGKLEGPEIITDLTKFPKTFKEAPALADLVKASKLQAVKERIGQDPLVVKPLHEVGRYGGTWRRGFSGPADYWNGFRCCGHDHLLFWDYTGNEAVPNVAKGWEVGDGGRTFTVFLRKGMKWSDGHPFTADDFMFWFEDMYQNNELVPTKAAVMSINGKPGVMEKVDDSTIRFRFEDPYYVFLDVLSGSTPLAGHSYHPQLQFMGGFAPKHYMKQFLPKYAGKEAVDKIVKAEGYDNWVSLLKFKNDWTLNPALPVVTPWKTTSPMNTPVWTLERNPYFYMVDTAGNQLPYIDKVVMTLAENLEVLNLRAIAGEYDFQARHIDIGKLAVLLENQKKAGYRVYLDPADSGCDACLFLSQTYDADPEIAKWLQNRDFRSALSQGIDRDQLNEAFWLGIGTPGSQVPAENNPYNPGPEYRTLLSTYQPDKANQILDGLGLTKKDGEGYRLRTDGRGRLRIEIMTVGGQFLQFTQIAEMIREHWKKIGIQADVSEVERSLAITRNAGNQTQAHLWQNDGTEHTFTFPAHLFPYLTAGLGGTSIGAPWAQWFLTDGTQGREPSPRMRELMSLWKKAFGVPYEERVKLGKQIWRIAVEEQWAIGTVGLSPAAQGVRVVSVKMGNIPERQYNSPDGMTPATSRPETFFFRQ